MDRLQHLVHVHTQLYFGTQLDMVNHSICTIKLATHSIAVHISVPRGYNKINCTAPMVEL